MGYDKFSPNFHGHYAAWKSRNAARQYRIELLPRGHYKSTLSTITDSVQIVLPDDTGNQPHPRNLGTNCRLAIVHEVADSAALFLSAIKAHFTTNPLLMALFPECVPQKGGRFNNNQLDLPRSKVWIEPTIEAIGISTRAQGRHYNYVKCDDIYGVEARDSEAVHKSTISWIDSLPSLLVTPKSDHIDFIGTRYRHDDVYNYIMELYEDDLMKYIRPIYNVDPVTKKKIFIFPEEFTWESTAKLRKNEANWNSNYMNNPYVGMGEFQQDWEQYYKLENGTIVFNKGEGRQTRNLLDLDRVIMIDPATVGHSGIVVTGTDWETEPNVFILEAIEKKYGPEELCSEIFRLVDKYNPRVVYIEEVLFSVLYQNWFRDKMTLRNKFFRIEGIKTQQKSKPDRVRGLRNWFANLQVFFNAEGMEFLIDQFRKFGAIKEYHTLDALAYGPRVWRASEGRREIERRQQAVEWAKSQRDRLTGYSQIKRAG